MKLLITGAAGFVASRYCIILIDSILKFHITGIDNFSYGYKDRLKP